jgi:beta-xylosidase
MFDYYLFESTDMVHWENQGVVVRYDVFSWARGSDTSGNANAAHVIERDDESGNPKFYFYAPVEGGQSEWGISIGVAVADNPEGPFEDARGIPLIYLADTAGTGVTHTWRNLDPAVFVDDNGQAYLYWGNQILYWVRLEDDMIHLQGETYTTDANGMMQNRDISGVQIHTVTNVTQYEEAPWVSKHGGLYYLTYASGFPESIAHATSSSPEGPWQYRGVILDPVPNSSTIHPAVFDFCGATYVAHHNGALPTGGSYRRSTCMDRVSFGADGTIDRIPASN